MSADMPDRYAPDPWVDAKCFADARRTNESVHAHVPTIVCRDWLSLSKGDEVGFREVSTGFEFGTNVPGDDARAVATAEPGDGRVRVRIPVDVLSRLHASSNGTVRIHRVDESIARLTNPIPTLEDL